MKFTLNTRVTGLDFASRQGRLYRGAHPLRTGRTGEDIKVNAKDKVLVTLGSMTEGSSLGSMDEPAPLKGNRMAVPGLFGRRSPPSSRNSVAPPTSLAILRNRNGCPLQRLSTTQPSSLVRDLTGNVPGEGGLITFPESRLVSVDRLAAPAPFHRAARGRSVFWGYGLSVDKPGDFVTKPMSACTGREIMTEIIGHLRLEAMRTRYSKPAPASPA